MRFSFAVIVLTITSALAAVCSALAASTAPVPGTFDGCPHGLLPLPSLSATDDAAIRHASTSFMRTTYAKLNSQRHWKLQLASFQLGRAFLIRTWLPTGWIKQECSRAVWEKSAGVGVALPEMRRADPACADCAHIVLILGKHKSGWAVWGQQ